MKIYLPLDSAALALGADEIAEAIHIHARAKAVKVDLIRNGSRGMVWLEPLVEVETPSGRLAFGPMTLADVPALFGDLAAHPKALGKTEDLPWLKAQTRLTFARVGVIDPLSLADYKAHGGLAGLTRALGHGHGRDRGRSHRFRPARPWWCRFSHRHQVEDGVRGESRAEIHRLQRR